MYLEQSFASLQPFTVIKTSVFEFNVTMTGLCKAQRQMRNYSAAEKLKEMTGGLYQSVQIIPKYLFSRN